MLKDIHIMEDRDIQTIERYRRMDIFGGYRFLDDRDVKKIERY